MRLQYAALLSLFVSLPSVALTFQPRLEHAEWRAEGDQFECRLIQPIKTFGGVGQFVRRAGEQPTFQLISRERWLGNGAATLLVAAAPGARSTATSALARSRSTATRCCSRATTSRRRACSPA